MPVGPHTRSRANKKLREGNVEEAKRIIVRNGGQWPENLYENTPPTVIPPKLPSNPEQRKALRDKLLVLACEKQNSRREHS